MPDKMYPRFRHPVPSFLPSAVSTVNHTCVHTHNYTHTPSPHLELEDTIASPRVFYSPISLYKSCSFFKTHFPLPYTHLPCLYCPRTVWYHLLSICVTSANYVFPADWACFNCRDHASHIWIDPPAAPLPTHTKQEPASGPVHLLSPLPRRPFAQRAISSFLPVTSLRMTSLASLSKTASTTHTHHPLGPFPTLFLFVLSTAYHMGMFICSLSVTHATPLH